MRIGVISEDKTDYDAIDILIKKITSDSVNTIGSYGMGKADIIHKKKKHSDKLFNFNCDFVIIVRDSDGAEISPIEDQISAAYDDTRIGSIYKTCIAIQEIESWFLADLGCIRKLYNIPLNSKRITQNNTDDVIDPKEVLKSYVEKWTDGENSHVQSDSKLLAENLDINKASTNSKSFLDFKNIVMAIAANS